MSENWVEFLSKLKEEALEIGASDATIIDATIISIEDKIIEYCQEPPCKSYGKSANCPPYAMQPAHVRKLVGQYAQALVFKTDEDKPCRFPSLARPSMEAVGIDVFGLATKVGWDAYMIRCIEPNLSEIPSAMSVGIVFIY